VCLEISNSNKMGLAISAEVEPVIAKTTMIIKTCQFEVIFQRSLNVPIFLYKKQIYIIYTLRPNSINSRKLNIKYLFKNSKTIRLFFHDYQYQYVQHLEQPANLAFASHLPIMAQ